MLPDIHASIRALLTDRGGISPLEIDVTFEMPTRERIERVMRPTINFFLYEMMENTDLRQSAMQTRRANGHAERKLAPRRIDLRYLVSALTTDPDDEHRLLWRTLVTLMRYPQLPENLMPNDLRGIDPPLTARVAQADDGAPVLDLWSGLETQPRLALSYVVTAPLDLDFAIRAPLVLTRTTHYLRATEPQTTPDSAIHIGGIVRAANGEPLSGAMLTVESRALSTTTDTRGAFVLTDLHAGRIAVRVADPAGVERVVMLDVPSPNYEITLD